MSKQLKMYKISLTMLLLLVCSSSAQAANAEKKPGFAKQKYYSFYDDGGEHQVDSCELANKLPKKLSKKLLKTKLATYLGSEQIEFAEKTKPQ